MTLSSQPRDPNRESIRVARESIERRALVEREISSAAKSVEPVKRMSRAETKGDIASKLKKTGVMLVALPDPATGVIGVPMLAAGYALEKSKGRALTLPQMADEFSKTLKELEKLRRASLK